MDPNLRLLLAASEHPEELRPAPRRRAFGLEVGRSGIFLRLGRTEAYLCTEPDSAWTWLREAGGLDAQAWRLHLIVDRVPG